MNYFDKNYHGDINRENESSPISQVLNPISQILSVNEPIKCAIVIKVKYGNNDDRYNYNIPL